MKLVETDYRCKEEEKAIYEATEFEIENYYKVERFIHTYKDGGSFTRYCVQKNYEIEYLPEIYYRDDGLFSKEPGEFLIQTTAYGAKNIEEIDKIIKGYQIAQEAAKLLNAEFVK